MGGLDPVLAELGGFDGGSVLASLLMLGGGGFLAEFGAKELVSLGRGVALHARAELGANVLWLLLTLGRGVALSRLAECGCNGGVRELWRGGVRELWRGGVLSRLAECGRKGGVREPWRGVVSYALAEFGGSGGVREPASRWRAGATLITASFCHLLKKLTSGQKSW